MSNNECQTCGGTDDKPQGHCGDCGRGPLTCPSGEVGCRGCDWCEGDRRYRICIYCMDDCCEECCCEECGEGRSPPGSECKSCHPKKRKRINETCAHCYALFEYQEQCWLCRSQGDDEPCRCDRSVPCCDACGCLECGNIGVLQVSGELCRCFRGQGTMCPRATKKKKTFRFEVRVENSDDKTIVIDYNKLMEAVSFH